MNDGQVPVKFTFLKITTGTMEWTPDKLEEYFGVRELPQPGDEFAIVVESVDEEGNVDLQLRPRSTP
jgi:hypothetical protein